MTHKTKCFKNQYVTTPTYRAIISKDFFIHSLEKCSGTFLTGENHDGNSTCIMDGVKKSIEGQISITRW